MARRLKERQIAPLNEEQLTAVLATEGPVRVAACAGSGKTSMLVERCGFLVEEKKVDPDRVLLVTFSSDAKMEMERRLKKRLPSIDMSKSVRTAHSIGLQVYKAEHNTGWTIDPTGKLYKGIIQHVLAEDGITIQRDAIGVKSWTAMIWDFAEVVKREVLGHHEIAEAFGAVDPRMEALGAPQVRAYYRRVEQLRKQGVTVEGEFVLPVTYDDMLYDTAIAFRESSVRERWARRYDYVMQDETQDESPVQRVVIDALASNSGNYCVVGDAAQCHPPGVMIETDRGQTPVERLATGQLVRGWNKHAQRMLGGRAVTVSSRQYSGVLHEVVVAGRVVPMTPNHKVLARWTDRNADVKTCVTYLMWRAEYGYRVGWCQLFAQRGEGCVNFHLAHRSRMELSEKTWILRVHESRTDASVYESIVAAGYGIPTAMFEPVANAEHMSRKSLDAIYSHPLVAQGLHERGERCLREHGLEPSLPLYPFPPTELYDPEKKYRRATYFPVYAVNVLPGLMSLPLPDGPNTWSPVMAVSTRAYEGPVYSLDVEKDHAYAANGVVVLNSIYGFRGGAASGLLDFESRWPSAKTIKLVGNYRSGQEIVATANTILRQMPARTVIDLQMVCKRGTPSEVTGATYQNIGDEARAIAEEIFTIGRRAEEPDWREFAVLTRTNESLAVISEAFKEAELPHRVSGESFPKGARNVVTLCTVHAAKGRQWTNVYLAQAYDTNHDSTEERRVFYVAVTRARDRLTISYSHEGVRFGGQRPLKFLAEAGIDMDSNVV